MIIVGRGGGLKNKKDVRPEYLRGILSMERYKEKGQRREPRRTENSIVVAQLGGIGRVAVAANAIEEDGGMEGKRNLPSGGFKTRRGTVLTEKRVSKREWGLERVGCEEICWLGKGPLTFLSS